MRKLGERFEGDSREIELVAGYLHLNFFSFIFGSNPNGPYEVSQLFGAAGNQLDGIKQWDSYEVESQKYLQIGKGIIHFWHASLAIVLNLQSLWPQL